VLGDRTIPPRAFAALDGIDGASPVDLSAAARRLDVGALGTRAWMAAAGSGQPDVLLLGTGAEAPSGAVDVREAAMIAGNTVQQARVASLLHTADSASDVETVVAESWAMGAYRFGAEFHACEEVVMWGCAPEAVRTGKVIADAANTARDLVNTPPAQLTPERLAERVVELGHAHGFRARLIASAALAEAGFHGLLAVGAASAHPPLVVELDRGDPKRPHLALVGKGITFDAGGLSLKTTDQMRTMKADMAGAAAVVGALIAADTLAPSTHVRGYLACAENMPGGGALRIGDVIRHRNGLSTEVLDTDCEGRLALSDVLSYAADAHPTHIVDIATLSSTTGLGPEIWAGMGTDRAAVRSLLAAGTASGEPGWELPLWERYAPRLRSDVAELKNYDSSTATGLGAIYAGLYLKRFIGGVPWAHVDLGLTVMRRAATEAWRTGANGNGTRTLARFVWAATPAGGESRPTHPRDPRDLVQRNEPLPRDADHNR
jgi:leucyl aminopeptidase